MWWNWTKIFKLRKKTAECTPQYPHNTIRRIVNANTIRARLSGLGWQIIERPLKRSNPDPSKRKIYEWKIIAVKGDQSIETRGPNLDQAMMNLGKSLGVIPS